MKTKSKFDKLHEKTRELKCDESVDPIAEKIRNAVAPSSNPEVRGLSAVHATVLADIETAFEALSEAEASEDQGRIDVIKGELKSLMKRDRELESVIMAAKG